MKIGPGGIVLLVITLLVGAALGGFLHVFVVDLNGNLLAHAATWGLVLLGAFRLWRAARVYRDLDDEAPTRRLANELPQMLDRMKAAREEAVAAAEARGDEPSTSGDASAPDTPKPTDRAEKGDGPETTKAPDPSADEDPPKINPSSSGPSSA